MIDIGIYIAWWDRKKPTYVGFIQSETGDYINMADVGAVIKRKGYTLSIKDTIYFDTI